MKKFILFSLVLFPLFFAACTKKQEVAVGAAPTVDAKQDLTPEEVVKRFVELSANAKADLDRAKLQELCSGEMRRAFERMTPEAFKISYLNSNVKIQEVKFLESKKEENTAVVLYEVSLHNAQGTDVTQESNRRKVELTKAQGAWLIDSIRPEGSDKIAFTRGMIF